LLLWTSVWCKRNRFEKVSVVKGASWNRFLLWKAQSKSVTGKWCKWCLLHYSKLGYRMNDVWCRSLKCSWCKTAWCNQIFGVDFWCKKRRFLGESCCFERVLGVYSCCFERVLGVYSSWFSWLRSVLVYPRMEKFRMKRLLWPLKFFLKKNCWWKILIRFTLTRPM